MYIHTYIKMYVETRTRTVLGHPKISPATITLPRTIYTYKYSPHKWKYNVLNIPFQSYNKHTLKDESTNVRWWSRKRVVSRSVLFSRVKIVSRAETTTRRLYSRAAVHILLWCVTVKRRISFHLKTTLCPHTHTHTFLYPDTYTHTTLTSIKLSVADSHLYFVVFPQKSQSQDHYTIYIYHYYYKILYNNLIL